MVPKSLGCAPTYFPRIELDNPMTAHVCCSGCDATFKLATFGPDSWRAATSDLQRFLEDHRPCREACGDKPAFTLRYDPESDS